MIDTKVRRWVLCFAHWCIAGVEHLEIRKCEGEHIPVVPAANFDALAKRVEELEAEASEAVHAMNEAQRAEGRALAVVEAARPHAHCYGSGTLADALADFDKGEK